MRHGRGLARSALARGAVVVAVLALLGCQGDRADGRVAPAAAPRPPAPAPAGSATTPSPIETTRDKLAGTAAPAPAKDGSKGDRQDSEWVPAEHKSGMARWKDVGVYVDGRPVGFLTWGELPIGLQPTWVEDKVSAEKRPGTDDPGYRIARQRFYRMTDYLRALGVDVRAVKELHVYGTRLSQTNISTGADLRSPAADGLMFRFGGNTSGKPLPQFPDGFGNGKTPDKIAGVMVYIKKKPPTLVYNQGLELDGVMQTGVPYYGEPLRGGVRVYLDDRLAAIIKRQELVPARATTTVDGAPAWRLQDVLAAQGADTAKVVELWVIRDDRRAERLPASALATLTFTASSQAKGGIELTSPRVRANALALHTRPLRPDQLPVVTPDDE